MKTLYVSALAAAALLCAPLAHAEETKAGTVVAVVDVQKIMRDSTAAQSASKQLEDKQKSFQNELNKKDEQLQKEDKELAKQRGVLSKEAFEEKTRDFRKKVTDVQKEVHSKKSMLDAAYSGALNDIQKVVTEIIADLAKEKGFAVAIPTSQVLYAESALDISDEVLERLNKKLPKLKVKFESPK